MDCWDAEQKKEKASDGGQKRGKRSTDKPTPTKILHSHCVHKTLDLKAREDVWWCKKDSIGKKDWYQFPHGCVNCKALFVNIGASAKIRLPKDYVFPSKDTFDSFVRDEIASTRKLF